MEDMPRVSPWSRVIDRKVGMQARLKSSLLAAETISTLAGDEGDLQNDYDRTR